MEGFRATCSSAIQLVDPRRTCSALSRLSRGDSGNPPRSGQHTKLRAPRPRFRSGSAPLFANGQRMAGFTGIIYPALAFQLFQQLERTALMAKIGCHVIAGVIGLTG